MNMINYVHNKTRDNWLTGRRIPVISVYTLTMPNALKERHQKCDFPIQRHINAVVQEFSKHLKVYDPLPGRNKHGDQAID